MVDTQAFIEALCTTPRDQALAVLGELLRNRPTLAPAIVGFACPDLTYAPARGISEKRAMGTLKSFSQKTGFGFIACPELHEAQHRLHSWFCPVFGADVFVHVKQMGPFSSVLMPGTPVTFAVVIGKENKPQAYDVQPMDGLLAESTIHNVSESMVDMSQMSQMATFPGAFTGLGGFQDPFTGFGHTEIPPKTAPAAAKRKWEDVTAELGRFRGVVKSFNGAKGFGFIISEELQAHGYTQDVFLSQAHTPATAQAGSNVSFTAFLNERSQPQAKNVELI
ncbi:unnamed protein product [Durusdinium trenchii]|uniref:CSD domain-containing protein n=3 Tax=Durusdinium trenchii TaxID=1381693 RepID=A0ABP0HUV9_9DINO